MSDKALPFNLASVLLLLAFASCNFIQNTQVPEAQPRRVSPQEIPRMVRAIPSYTSFSYSGLCFFNRKLYASSNIGLLESEGGGLLQLYKWYDSDDVVSGPWLDLANNSVWVMHDGIGRLIRYDGKAWEIRELPRPKEGYSRGDMLAGFRGMGTPEGFWLEGGGHAWRWNTKSSTWEPAPMPQDGSVVRVIPLPSQMLVVTRHESLSFLVEGDHFKSDTVHYYEGQWNEVPNKTGRSFFTEQMVVVRDGAYLLTSNGFILSVTQSEITRLDTQDDCEAIVATTAGSLLASFRNFGIYEYRDGWQKRFSCPYSSTEADHWSYLAEFDGQVAFAVTSKSQGHGEGTKYRGQTALWVSAANELKHVPIGEMGSGQGK